MAATNDLIANLSECRRHDGGMQAESGLLKLLQLHSFNPAGNMVTQFIPYVFIYSALFGKTYIKIR